MLIGPTGVVSQTRLELHRLHSKGIFTHASIYQLHAAWYELVTATPMFNKGIGMRSLLYFVQNPNRRSATAARLVDYSHTKAILYGTEQPLSK